MPVSISLPVFMYTQYFRLSRLPFTISPDPGVTYLSEGHREALAHLRYSLSGHGGLICLTGEVGTGKTTLCRLFLGQVGEKVKTAYIYNPRLSSQELLASLCDELEIGYPGDASEGDLYRYLQSALLNYYSAGYQVVCVIDEAQAMPVHLLEMIRLLTNLETSTEKLMTLILVGQPELRELLGRHDLRQLNQRITARYHLKHLQQGEVGKYVEFRLAQAGTNEKLFSTAAINRLWRLSGGIPRKINVIADRALLGAYASEKKSVSHKLVNQASREVSGEDAASSRISREFLLVTTFSFVAFAAVVFAYWAGMFSFAVQKPEAILAEGLGISADNCETISRQSSYRCLWTEMPVRDLERSGLPYVITVTDSAGRSLWKTSLAVDERYGGRALVLWRGPDNYGGEIIRPGEFSPVVTWVKEKLGLSVEDWSVIGSSASAMKSFAEFYDPVMADSVAEFQQSNGLTPDKILGPKTIFYLSLLD